MRGLRKSCRAWVCVLRSNTGQSRGWGREGVSWCVTALSLHLALLCCADLVPSRPRARRAHATTGSPSSPARVPQNSGVEGLGHALARADPRAALNQRDHVAQPKRSTTQCEQRRGRGRPRLTAAAARVLAALCRSSRTPTRRALAAAAESSDANSDELRWRRRH